MLNENFTKFGDKIFVYKNFLSKEEISKILDSVEMLSESDWKPTNGDHMVSPWMENCEFVSYKIRDSFPEDLEMHNRMACVVRMQEGGFWGDHVDNYDHTGVVDKIDLYKEGMEYEDRLITSHGIIVYLNDNYEGGELHYRNQGITYVPQAGDLVVHEADEICRHEVNKVISGNRYTMTSSLYKKVRIPKQDG